MSIEFLLTTFVVVATPGTGVIYTVAAGLSRGARASLVAAIGCTLGILPHMLAAVTGLAALLHSSVLAFETLRYAGVAYLLYLAWMTLKDDSAFAPDEAAAPRSPWRVIRTAILINILNPKLTLFFFAFLPQFVPASDPTALVRMIGLSGVFMAVTLVVFATYGVFASAVRAQLLSRPRVMTWMGRVFGASFIALSARLAVEER